MNTGRNITSVRSSLTMAWREAEAQIMQMPKHDICVSLQGAFLAMKFKCEPFDVSDIHILHTRGV